MQKFSYENEFDLHENKLAGETQCHKNGYTRKLIFTLRQRELRNGLFSQEIGKNELNWSHVRVIMRLPWQH